MKPYVHEDADDVPALVARVRELEEQLDDTVVARIHHERADSRIMAARYDDAVRRLDELHDENAELRRRADRLEGEIEDMLTIEEGNSRAWLLKCARVRELEEGAVQLRAHLREMQNILDRHHNPYSTAHAHNCIHAVAELRALLGMTTHEEP